jgi:hypothetical protein
VKQHVEAVNLAIQEQSTLLHAHPILANAYLMTTVQVVKDVVKGIFYQMTK